MESEYYALRSQFFSSYVSALIAAVVLTVDVHLLYIGQVGGHWVIGMFVAAACTFMLFSCLGDAWSNQGRLKHLKKLMDQNPFGSRTRNVDPEDAVRSMGSTTRRGNGGRGKPVGR